MASNVQGDGTHLPHGSIMAEINRLRLALERSEARVRSLEGVVRDVAVAAGRALAVLERP